jgi:hypothetical protein
MTDTDIRHQVVRLVTTANTLRHYSTDLIRELAAAVDEPTPQRIAGVSAQRHRLQHAALLIDTARKLVAQCITTEETTA